MFDNIRSDLRAHGGRYGAQGFWALVVYRFGRWRYGVRPTLLRKLFSMAYHVLYKIVQVLTGIELPCEVQLGRNFVIDHFGGIVVSGFAQFGDDCRIRNGVVVGLARIDDPYALVTGYNADADAGAKLLRRTRIGDNFVIRATPVVIHDVPSGSKVVDIPAVARPRQPTHRANTEHVEP